MEMNTTKMPWAQWVFNRPGPVKDDNGSVQKKTFDEVIGGHLNSFDRMVLMQGEGVGAVLAGVFLCVISAGLFTTGCAIKLAIVRDDIDVDLLKTTMLKNLDTLVRSKQAKVGHLNSLGKDEISKLYSDLNLRDEEIFYLYGEDEEGGTATVEKQQLARDIEKLKVDIQTLKDAESAIDELTKSDLLGLLALQNAVEESIVKEISELFKPNNLGHSVRNSGTAVGLTKTVLHTKKISLYEGKGLSIYAKDGAMWLKVGNEEATRCMDRQDFAVYALNVARLEIGKDADLRNAHFVGLDFTGFNFSDFLLEYANFGGAILNDVQFKGTDLRNAILIEAKVEQTDFTNATIDGAYAANVDFTKALGLTRSMKDLVAQGYGSEGVKWPKPGAYRPPRFFWC